MLQILFVLLLPSVAQVSGRKMPSANASCSESAVIDPNVFKTEPEFSRGKLYENNWYSHYYYSTVHSELIISGLIMDINAPRWYASEAAVTIWAKQLTKCIHWNATWIFEGKGAKNFKQETRNNKVSSAWILDRKDEDFIIVGFCLGTYHKEWHNASECPHWSFAVFFQDASLRSDAEIQKIEEKLQKRICYPVSKLAKSYSKPSYDCLPEDVARPENVFQPSYLNTGETTANDNSNINTSQISVMMFMNLVSFMFIFCYKM